MRIEKKIKIPIIMILILIGLMNWRFSAIHHFDVHSTFTEESFERKNISISSFALFSCPIPKLSNLVSHSSIFIDGDQDFHNQALIEGWDILGTRNGSHSAPYKISGYEIKNNSDNLITIRNTTLHFVLSQNLLTNMSNLEGPIDGINCINVTNGVIRDNYIQGSYDSSRGLWCKNSNVLFVNNTVSGFGMGILIMDNSTLQILNNTLVHNPIPIYIDRSSNNLIADNILVDSYITIMGGGSINFPCSNNTFCSNFIIDFYRAFYFGGYGENNRLLNNEISDGSNGILLERTSNYHVAGNNIFNLKGSAIVILSFHDGTTPLRNNISKNTIHHCGFGLILQNTQNNTITENLFYDQKSYAICVKNEEEYPPGLPPKKPPSLYNNIINNTFYNNSLGDLALYPDTAENIIILNKFLVTISSNPHILDNGSFNHIRFNYYAEWPSWDSNHDGVIDVPYPIAGSANNSDLCPLASMNPIIDISPFTNISFCCPIINSSSSFISSLKYFGIISLIAIPILIFTYIVIRKKK